MIDPALCPEHVALVHPADAAAEDLERLSGARDRHKSRLIEGLHEVARHYGVNLTVRAALWDDRSTPAQLINLTVQLQHAEYPLLRKLAKARRKRERAAGLR